MDCLQLKQFYNATDLNQSINQPYIWYSLYRWFQALKQKIFSAPAERSMLL